MAQTRISELTPGTLPIQDTTLIEVSVANAAAPTGYDTRRFTIGDLLTRTSYQAGAGIAINTATDPDTLSLIIPVAVASGGTGAANAATAISNLGGLPVAGGTITGSLTVQGTTTLAAATATTPVAGNNSTSIATTAWVSGKNYVTGGPYMPISGGNFTASIGVNATGADAGLVLNKPAGAYNNLVTGNRAGVARWQIQLGNTVAESGGNNGSDFAITRFSNAGTYIDTPIFIGRGDGVVLFSHNPVISMPAGNFAQISYAVAGVRQWQTGADDNGYYFITDQWAAARRFEINTNGDATVYGYLTTTGLTVYNGLNIVVPYGGSSLLWYLVDGLRQWYSGINAGGSYVIADQTAGAYRLSINTIGEFSFNGSIGVTGSISSDWGYRTKAGVSGGFSGNSFNINWSVGVPELWVDSTFVGVFAFTSDYRVKKDIAPLPPMWDRVKTLRPISYTHREFSPPSHIALAEERAEPVAPLFLYDDTERWGFIAHELQESLLPSAANGEKDSPNEIQSPNPFTLLAVLTKALQEAMERIESLERQRDQ